MAPNRRLSERGTRVNYTISLTPELRDEIQEMARMEDRPKAWVVRELLRLGLKARQRGERAPSR